MAPPPSRIYDVCEDLLAAVVDHHGGADLPARQYVSAGPPAWDCELLATWCEQTAGGVTPTAAGVTDAMTSGAAWAMRVGTIVVTIARCAPTQGDSGEPPSVDQEEGAARTLYEDAQRVLNALITANREGTLGSCHGVAFLGWRVLGPEGGLVAGELRVAVGLATGL